MTDPTNWPVPTGPPVAGPPPATAEPVTGDRSAVDPLTGQPVGADPGNIGLAAPPPGAPPLADDRGRVRPWWGMGDVLLVLPIMVVVLAVGFAAIGILASLEGVSLQELSEDDAPLPGSMIVIPTLIQQLSWFGWPFVVSRWKGLGPASDWGWSFERSDLGVGLGTAMIGLFAAGAVGATTAAIVDLEDETTAENTALVSDLEGSPWLWGVLFLVVVGAPLAEEILFRGLVLRAVAKRWGSVAGVIGSLLAFVPIHLADGGVFTDEGFGINDGQLVLWATIGALGLVLAVATVLTKRLGAAIVAHVLINAVGVVGALGLWEDLGLARPLAGLLPLA